MFEVLLPKPNFPRLIPTWLLHPINGAALFQTAKAGNLTTKNGVFMFQIANIGIQATKGRASMTIALANFFFFQCCLL